MRVSRTLFLLFVFFVVFCSHCCASDIGVFIKIRGESGKEDLVKETLGSFLEDLDGVSIVEKREECHIYLDLALVEQEPIRFYGLGIAISYYIKDNLYSRPTSDVAQFGEERIKDVCSYLAGEIDKGFISPLRVPAER